MRQFPHCDPRVLHKPGECSTCDEHAADLQELRKVWGINFTNHHELHDEHNIIMLPCPAEVARPLSIINRWFGNTAKNEADWIEFDKQMEEVAKLFQDNTDCC